MPVLMLLEGTKEPIRDDETPAPFQKPEPAVLNVIVGARGETNGSIEKIEEREEILWPTNKNQMKEQYLNIDRVRISLSLLRGKSAFPKCTAQLQKLL